MRLILLVTFLSACQPSLERQPRVKPYSEGATRLAPDHTVAQEDHAPPPVALSRATLAHGRDLYEVNCAVCHGFSGRGDGMAVQRGFPRPASLITKLTSVADTARIVAGGQGTMFGLGERIGGEDRLAIAIYVRALQWRAHPPKESK